MTRTMQYNSPTTGRVSVLVSLLPTIPLEIIVLDEEARARVELVGGDAANQVQVGPGEGSFGMLVRAVRRTNPGQEVIRQVFRGVSFSSTSEVGGNSTVVQCGGTMSFGDSRKAEGAYLRLPRGSRLSVTDAGEITVLVNNWTCTLQEAVDRGLLEVEI